MNEKLGRFPARILPRRLLLPLLIELHLRQGFKGQVGGRVVLVPTSQGDSTELAAVLRRGQPSVFFTATQGALRRSDDGVRARAREATLVSSFHDLSRTRSPDRVSG